MHHLHLSRYELRQRLRSDEGATAVEYGIMVALIAVAIILAVFTLGDTLNDTFNTVNTCIDDPTQPNCS